MFRNHRRISLTLLALFLMSAIPAAALDLGGHDRDGVVVGLLMGHGWNQVDFKNSEGVETSLDDINAFNGTFRVGWARSDHLMASIGFNGFKRSYYRREADVSTTYYSFLLETHWFPRGEGFWIKGGIGRGSLDLDIMGVRRTIIKESGLALTAGAGYEFRLADEMAFGISYDFQHTDIGDFAQGTDTKAISHALSMSLNFYVQ